MEIVLGVFLPFLDRCRGGLFVGGATLFRRVRPWLWSLLMGAAIATLLDFSGWRFVLAVAGFQIGEQIGWGGPVNKVLRGQHARAHWWQVGFLKSSPWAALVVRGALWGIFPTAMTLGAAWVLVPIFAFAVPAGVLFGKKWQVEKENPWGSSEWFRGGIVAGSLIIYTAM